MRDLGTLCGRGRRVASALAVNQYGLVVGSSATSAAFGSPYHGFVVQLLPLLPRRFRR